jgi:hypothetical protein
MPPDAAVHHIKIKPLEQAVNRYPARQLAAAAERLFRRGADSMPSDKS